MNRTQLLRALPSLPLSKTSTTPHYLPKSTFSTSSRRFPPLSLPTTSHSIVTSRSQSLPPAPSPPIFTQQQRNVGWLKRRVANLRLRGLNAKKEEDRWDPWDQKTRDFDLKPDQLNAIKTNAHKHREKQLEQIVKFQKKQADKEAALKTPVLYAQQQKLNKVTFRQRLKNLWAWLKEPRNYLHRYFFHIEDPAELSVFQKCIFVYRKSTIAALLLLSFAFPRIPVVSNMLNELSRHRDRKKRGVLGLDEYCTPQRQNAHLEYIRTGDFAFDIRYLQKMTLRDLYVLDNLNTVLVEMTEERMQMLQEMLNRLETFDKDPTLTTSSRKLNSFQREAFLKVSEYYETFTNELNQGKELVQLIKDQWFPQIADVRASVDIQLDTIFNQYFTQNHKRDQYLKTLIQNGQQVRDWRIAIEDEFTIHQQHLHALYEAYEMLCDDPSKSEFDKMMTEQARPRKRFEFPGVVNAKEPRRGIPTEQYRGNARNKLNTRNEINQEASREDGEDESRAIHKTSKKPNIFERKEFQDELNKVQRVLSGEYTGDFDDLTPKKYSEEELNEIMELFQQSGAELATPSRDNAELAQLLNKQVETSNFGPTPPSIELGQQDGVNWFDNIKTFVKGAQPPDVDGYLKKLQVPGLDMSLLFAQDPNQTQAAGPYKPGSIDKADYSSVEQQSEKLPSLFASLSENQQNQARTQNNPSQSILPQIPAQINQQFAPKHQNNREKALSTATSSLPSSSTPPNTMFTPPGAQSLLGPHRSTPSLPISPALELDDAELAELLAFKESKIAAHKLAQEQINQQQMINQNYSQRQK